MPYVNENYRVMVDSDLDELINTLKEVTIEGTSNSGVVTYVLFKICKKIYGKQSYETQSNALKVLESTKLEFYRTVMSEYEDVKVINHINSSLA